MIDPQDRDDSPYYYGSAENRLNSKGQVAVPARFRSVLSEADKSRGYVLVRGDERCIFMYTHRQFGRIKDNVRRLAEENGDRGFFREFMARAVPVEVDTQGRVMLAADLMREAGVKGPALLFIGMDDRIEIWEPGIYSAQRGSREGYDDVLRKAGGKIFGT